MRRSDAVEEGVCSRQDECSGRDQGKETVGEARGQLGSADAIEIGCGSTYLRLSLRCKSLPLCSASTLARKPRINSTLWSDENGASQPTAKFLTHTTRMRALIGDKRTSRKSIEKA